MNFELFISKRLFDLKKSSGFSTPIIKLAMVSIALGVAVMIISISVAKGFQNTIRQKVAGFEGHIRISKFDYNNSYELSPVSEDSATLEALRHDPDIESVSRFAVKGGILKHKGLIEGVILKGVGKDYNRTFFNNCLIDGHFPRLSDTARSKEILVSKVIADKLGIATGDKLLMYFVQKPPRIRRFTVAGIYNSGFNEFDSRYIIGDIKQIQRLNGWQKDMISGYEIMIRNFDDVDKVNRRIYKMLDYDVKSETVIQRYPMIMDWLNLLDTNVLFIIGLMILISGITIISTLLIIILEKTNLIGTLKAMGATTGSIRKIFVYKSLELIVIGILAGNLIGIALALTQKYLHLIPLDPENYYMNTVPVSLNFGLILALDIITLIITLLMLFWPSGIIAKISPVKAIKFE